MAARILRRSDARGRRDVSRQWCACEMAGRKLPGFVFHERWHDILAHGELCDRTPRVKDASAGRIERRGDVATEQNAALLQRGIRDRNGRKQRLRVWMQRVVVERPA